MRTDSEGVEIDVRTAFGRAQIPALLLFAVTALAGLGVAILGMQSVDRVTVTPKVESIDVEVDARRMNRRDPLRLGPEHDAIVNRGWDWYQACRTHQLLDTPDDPFAGTAANPGSSHLGIVHLVEHVLSGGLPNRDTCRPESWEGPSLPTSMPQILWRAGQDGEVDNPFYPVGDPISYEQVRDAEFRIQPLLEREWTGLLRGYVASVDGSKVRRPVTVVVPEVAATAEAQSLEIALIAAGTSVLSLLLLLAMALLPDRIRLSFGLRGVGLGRRHVTAQDIQAVSLEGGRVVLTLHSGETVRSPRLDEPEQVAPFIAQYQRLSAPVEVEESPELQALRGRQAAERARS